MNIKKFNFLGCVRKLPDLTQKVSFLSHTFGLKVLVRQIVKFFQKIALINNSATRQAKKNKRFAKVSSSRHVNIEASKSLEFLPSHLKPEETKIVHRQKKLKWDDDGG